jgi:hypothetical protein
LKIKVAKWGTPKKYLKKQYPNENINWKHFWDGLNVKIDCKIKTW